MVRVLIGWRQYFFFVYGKVCTAFEIELGRIFDVDDEALAHLWMVCAVAVHDRCIVRHGIDPDFSCRYSHDRC